MAAWGGFGRRSTRTALVGTALRDVALRQARVRVLHVVHVVHVQVHAVRGRRMVDAEIATKLSPGLKLCLRYI